MNLREWEGVEKEIGRDRNYVNTVLKYEIIKKHF